jgi:hypothetical protein
MEEVTLPKSFEEAIKRVKSLKPTQQFALIGNLL